MIFQEFHPIEDKIFRIIDNEGEVIDKSRLPSLSDDIILQAYKSMLYARTADQMAVSYQRQGRMYTYPPIIGQEAIQAASSFVVRPQDWVVPAFREMGLMLAKGVSLKEIFLLFRK